MAMRKERHPLRHEGGLTTLSDGKEETTWPPPHILTICENVRERLLYACVLARYAREPLGVLLRLFVLAEIMMMAA